ncbi:phosphate-starvation-inducible PsiE family protein [Salinisphaera sp.]|uniref:phosphate-starvation-inducible PsiE family protein n=1 Tax=Salinisphaera sp. TaxID=1914330 RepID=UPI002D772429|nr:phosphate-starvation-inducible PsiE family protein [Salinisphaera sp.]HET7315574.1 phosphate-starvation-inducible PsiE family protein [Salinisphaera sp.]
MPSHKPTGHTFRWIDRSFTFVEAMIYMALGALLAVAAVMLLVSSTVDFFAEIAFTQLDSRVVALLGRLLLVLLIAELLYTVKVSFSAGTIVLEPFLFIGLIAAIRRVFVLTAEFSDTGGGEQIPFREFVIELGALSVLILVIAVSLWLLRKSTIYEGRKNRHIRSDSKDIDSVDDA